MMDPRRARVKAREILEGDTYSQSTRDMILVELRNLPKYASPTTIKEIEKLLLSFEKKTCLARVYSLIDWRRDRYGEWDSDFWYLLVLEGKIYKRESGSPSLEKAMLREFSKALLTGITLVRDKGRFDRDEGLTELSEHIPEDFALIMGAMK